MNTSMDLPNEYIASVYIHKMLLKFKNRLLIYKSEQMKRSATKH